MATLKIEQLEASTTALKQDLSEKREQLRLVSTSSSGRGSTSGMSELKMELLEVKRDLARTKRELAEEKLAKSQLEREIESLRETSNGPSLSELQMSAMREKDDEIADLRSQLKEAQSFSKKLEQKAERIRRQSDLFESRRIDGGKDDTYVHGLEQRLRVLMQEHDELTQQMQLRAQESKDRLRSFDRELRDLQDEIDEKNIRISHLTKTIHSRDAEAATSEATLERMRRQFQALRKSEETNQKSIEQITRNLFEAERLRDSLEQRLRKAESDLEGAVSVSRDKDSQIAILQSQTQKDGSSASEDVAQAIRRANILEAKLEIASSKLENSTMAAKEKVATLEWQLNETREDLANRDEDLSSLKSEFRQLVEEVEKKEKKLVDFIEVRDLTFVVLRIPVISRHLAILSEVVVSSKTDSSMLSSKSQGKPKL